MFEGLSELTIGALAEDAAGGLLAASGGRPVDQRVGERIVAETGATRWRWSSSRGADGRGVIGRVACDPAAAVRGHLEELYLSLVRALPAEAQMLLLLAAADQLGDLDKIWKAAGQLCAQPAPA